MTTMTNNMKTNTDTQATVAIIANVCGLHKFINATQKHITLVLQEVLCHIMTNKVKINIKITKPVTTRIITNVRFVMQLQISSARHITFQVYHLMDIYCVFLSMIGDFYRTVLKPILLYLLKKTDSSSDSSPFSQKVIFNPLECADTLWAPSEAF